MPRQPWVFNCPVCDFDHVRVYKATVGRAAFVVCGRCRTLVVFDPAPKMRDPIDLYNLYCDKVRPMMGSYIEPIQPKATPQVLHPPTTSLMERSREAGGSVVFAAPLCVQHEFVNGEPIAGFRGEILAQTRICLRCGHAEREKV